METLYRALMSRRRAHNLARAALETVPCPIICVGNLTTGGTGKTPAVQWLAQSLQNRGWKVGIAARGYGGSASDAGMLVSDGRPPFKSALEAGDEAVLHARNLPSAVVAIAKNRHRAVEVCVQNGAQIVILDDGFQFWSLPRVFDLVLLDAKQPWGNKHLLPRGRLREEPASLRRASAILLTRCDRTSAEEIEKTRLEIGRFSFAPIFLSRHAPRDLRNEKSGEIIDLGFLKRREIKACAGLADNSQFYASLSRLGAAQITRLKRERGDHHNWKLGDFRWQGAPPLNDHQRLVFERLPLVTTEKDAVKLNLDWFGGPVLSLRIQLEIENEGELQRLIWSKLSSR
ncbi:MAG TPA: tetraacyldisaccharide 4'-kinase [Abditibacterium sp.]|jgi:tetraacyldisaccharide 4'-kinase